MRDDAERFIGIEGFLQDGRIVEDVLHGPAEPDVDGIRDARAVAEFQITEVDAFLLSPVIAIRQTNPCLPVAACPFLLESGLPLVLAVQGDKELVGVSSPEHKGRILCGIGMIRIGCAIWRPEFCRRASVTDGEVRERMGKGIVWVHRRIFMWLAVEDAFGIIFVFLGIHLIAQGFEAVQDFAGTVQRIGDSALEFGKGIVCVLAREVEVIASNLAVKPVNIIPRLIRQADNALLHRTEYFFGNQFWQRGFYVFAIIVDIACLVDRSDGFLLVIKEDLGITGCGREFQILCQFA